MLTSKDLIAINRQFHSGKLVNESSLDYAVELTARSKNWLRTAAYLVRAILIDHAFEDGNKRTAAAVIMFYLEANGLQYDAGKITKAVISILKKNTTNLSVIERVIKNAIE